MRGDLLSRWCRRFERQRRTAIPVALGLLVGAASTAPAQEPDSLPLPTAPTQRVVEVERIVEVTVGSSTVLRYPRDLRRVLMSNPEVAEASVVGGREIVVSGRAVGSTSLLVWDVAGQSEIFPVLVSANAALLQRQLSTLFPGERLTATASGGALILSGEVRDPRAADEARRLAAATGAEIIDRLDAPVPDQVLLRVRLAEVSRNVLRELGVQWLVQAGDANVTLGVSPFGDAFQDGQFQGTFSDALNLFLFRPDLDLNAFVRALQSRGVFRSLAEPNLIALDGQEASFLAGGEFPYPVAQGGTAGSVPAVSINFREFGVRLAFRPTLLPGGLIRLHVAPEVSTLDFAGGVQLSGFRIPTVLARRAETEVILRDGQTFAIAGLLDNSLTENLAGVPFLSDIPVLGALFRSRDLRRRQTELVVLVTPHLVQPTDVPPPIPTGEPADWPRSPGIRR